MRGNTVGWILAGALWTSTAHAQQQPLLVCPSQTDGGRIARLLQLQAPSALVLTIRARGSADTNVLPLARSSAHTASPRSIDDARPYFLAYQSSDIEMSRGAWSIGYSSTRADLYRGNSDAGQLYLDSLSEGFLPTSLRSPEATMNRTAAIRWRAQYDTPFRIGSARGCVEVAANYLRMQRVQLGALTGQANGEQFQGTISFLSTLDMPADETRSDGMGVDVGLAVGLSARWRASARCENLFSRVWQRGLQSIQADVLTNTIVADEDGFLYGAPLVGGTIGRASLRTEVRRRFDLGAAYRAGDTDLLAFCQEDIDWRLSVGATRPMGRGGRWWVLLFPSPVQFSSGISWGPVDLQIGLSDPNVYGAERANVSLAYRIRLE